MALSAFVTVMALSPAMTVPPSAMIFTRASKVMPFFSSHPPFAGALPFITNTLPVSFLNEAPWPSICVGYDNFAVKPILPLALLPTRTTITSSGKLANVSRV